MVRALFVLVLAIGMGTPRAAFAQVTIKGTVTLCGTNIPLSGVTFGCCAMSGCTVSDGNGRFELVITELPAFPWCISRTSTTEDWAAINDKDENLVLDHILVRRPVTFSPCQMRAIDLNKDSSVDTIDFILLLQWLEGVAPSSSPVATWVFTAEPVQVAPGEWEYKVSASLVGDADLSWRPTPVAIEAATWSNVKTRFREED